MSYYVNCYTVDVQTILTMAWDYHEVWKSLSKELKVDKSEFDTIAKNHSDSHDCLRALVEVWLRGARLTEDAAREAMATALQSVRVVRAMSGTFIIIIVLCINLLYS